MEVVERPTFMEPRDAAEALERALGDVRPGAAMTIADAATKSGLALRDAERGLQSLTSEYRGRLRVTEAGDLVYLFPHGFTKPWETKDAIDRLLAAAWRSVSGVGRFVVRAWLMIAILAYAGAFLALIVALAFTGNRDSNRGGFADVAAVLLRVVGDALFWTFHPFSPLAIDVSLPRGRARSKTPFYEKVNRFVFGPPPPPEDARATERAILAEVRAQKGRIGLADVMRVTGLARDEADPLMARLMLDYDGDVEVSDAGGITYTFEAMRLTANEVDAGARGSTPRPPPAWSTRKVAPPLTGNSAGSNLVVAALNGFNLIMGLVALDTNMTLARALHLFDRPPPGALPMPPMPYDGVPIVLGLVPVVFSLAIFLLPLGRALLAGARAKRASLENGRLAVMREVLEGVRARRPVTDDALAGAFRDATGRVPESKELTRLVVDLGGDVDLEAKELEKGAIRYRFVDLETEAEALEAEREAAADEEAKLGPIAFTT